MKRIIRSILAPGFRLIDNINSRLEPFKDYEGGDVPDYQDTEILYDKIKADTQRFLHLDGKLFWAEDPNSLGDQCIWHGVYTAWAVLDGDPTLIANAVEGMKLLSGDACARPGVLLRGVAELGEVSVDPNNAKAFGTTGPLMWRADASLDSLIGFCYGLTWLKTIPMYEPIALALAQRVARTMSRNGWRLINPDESLTAQGDMSPKLLQAPVRLLALLWIMKLAEFEVEYRENFLLAEPILEYGETHLLWKHPWFADHLAFLAYDGLRRLDDRTAYEKGMKRMFQKTLNQENYLFFTLAGSHINPDRSWPLYQWRTARALASFQYPEAKMAVEKINSTRADVTKKMWPPKPFKGRMVSVHPLGLNDRPASDYMWQRNPFTLDGWQGVSAPHVKYSGLDFLLVYAMFRKWWGVPHPS